MGTDYTLAYGTHASPQEGRCAMEWVSYLAGEAHSDEPASVSKVLRAFCIALNDGLEDGPRQRLRPYLARTIGTAADGLDGTRSWMAMDWLIRTYAAAWLELCGLDEPAQCVAALPAIRDGRSLAAALGVLNDARRDARDIAGDAAATVVREGRGGLGRAAARKAAYAALAPVLERLQASVFDLLDQMLPTVPLAMPVVEDADLLCSAAVGDA